MGIFKLFNRELLQAKVGPLTASEAYVEKDSNEAKDLDYDVASAPVRIDKPSTPTTKSVSFGVAEVRSYSITIGDHPLCTSGFPLTLDWDYTSEVQIPVDSFEASRGVRRRKEELILCAEERNEILSHCSEGDVRRGSRRLHRARSCSARLSEKVNACFFGDELLLQK